MRLITGSICGVLGLALLAWTVVAGRNDAPPAALSMRARGMIIGSQQVPDSSGRTLYYAQVEFATAEGRHHFQSQTGQPQPVRIGQEVDILYDPVMPGRAELLAASPDGRSLTRLLLGSLGLALLLPAVALLIQVGGSK